MIAKHSSDIQKQIKLLCATKDTAQITQIEAQIEAIKQKIRDLRAQGDKEKEKEKDVASAQYKKTQG